MRTQEPDQLRRLYRQYAGGILSRLIRTCDGDFDLAEEALRQAMSSALTAWSIEGEPSAPGAWLARTAQHNAISKLRRPGAAAVSSDVDTVNDDYLCLFFACCHRASSLKAQVALTLHSLCGLSTDEIARMLSLAPAIVEQRLARAKNKLRNAQGAYAVPSTELSVRLEPVLAVIHWIFSKGHAATGGELLQCGELCGEALRLGRLLTGLLPEKSEPWALLSLMLLLDSRNAARLSKSGELVLLSDQDRSLWDQAQIAEALGCLDRALGLGSVSPYLLQAAIAAHHARARSAAETDWSEIAQLYRRLLSHTENTEVALHHAAAVAEAEGPQRGLLLLDGLASDPALIEYHSFYAARADLLRRLGQLDAAARDYTEALRLVANEPERRYLARRLSELAGPHGRS